MAPLLLGPDAQTALAAGIRGREAAAEREFVALFERRIRIMLEVRLRDREAARDLTQDTLIAALEAVRSGQLREPERLVAFVYGIARNVANNHGRRRGSEPEPEPLTDDMATADAEAEMLERAQRSLALRAMEGLGADERRILRMTLVEGLKPGEIAARLGLGVDVVRTRKSRALRKVMAEIQRLSRTGVERH